MIGLLLLAGCASFSGRGLVPGKSVPAEVEALMGTPAERLVRENGESFWYYPRQPTGLQTFVVRFSPDGVMQDIEQRLTERNLARLVPGITTAKEVRELLGPPWRSARNFLNDRDCWDYRMYNASQLEYNLSVQFSDDGLVREVVFLQDYRVSGVRRSGK
jgi:outer membrane protein assembly factor BamE (lipoprotein component of BamABCDE complex)